MGIRTHSEYTEALLSQSEEIESTGGSFLFELNSADVQFFSIMYKILMRVFVVIFATKVHVFCNFCDTVARNCDFLHSKFSVAAAATHEQFWELKLELFALLQAQH